MIEIYRNPQLCSGLRSCGDCTQYIHGLVDGVTMDTEDEEAVKLIECSINICPCGAVTLRRVD